MLNLQTIIHFRSHSLNFHSKIHKHPGTFFVMGCGNLSLKRAHVEVVRERIK